MIITSLGQPFDTWTINIAPLGVINPINTDPLFATVDSVSLRQNLGNNIKIPMSRSHFPKHFGNWLVIVS